jgi:hypothetical protein
MKGIIILPLLLLFDLVAFSSAFNLGGIILTTPANRRRDQLKADLLLLSSETKRGLIATPEQKDAIQKLFVKLEKMNPTQKPLTQKNPDLINGVWSLEYTTSDSILGKKNSGWQQKVGPILQTIDTLSLTAENSEVVKYFGIFELPNKVTIDLSPQSDRLTNVQFKRFSVGPIGFDAPEKAKGYLDITYLDDNVRLSRGNMDNIFVLTRI